MTMIEVYADIWCPFAHVGIRSVVRRREELGRDEVVLRVRAWPLELVNGEPLDPIATLEHVEVLRAHVAPDLFAHLHPDHFPGTSLPALALAAAAYDQDDRTGEAVSLALRHALFEEGRDISRPEVLASLADKHGVGLVGPDDEKAVLVEWDEGVARGVKGSPHFFCSDVQAFCPSLDISRGRDGRIQVRRNVEALEAFLAHCFAN